MNCQSLTPGQIDLFIEQGYIVLPQAFSPAVASEWADQGFFRLGYDRHDPSTWKEKRIHMPLTRSVDVSEFAPAVWAAACDLVGGASRIAGPYRWGDPFICNLGIGRDKPWQPPSPAVGGWHKDGDFFRHFLDSPEQGLLTIVCWTDVVHQGGGTFIAPDSVGVVARFLAGHPEGVNPGDPAWRTLIGQCHEFIELAARAGDVILLHPYMLHASSQNVLDVERIITNPPVHLKDPMNFNRPNPADFSPVERAVLKALAVDRLDFHPTSPRQAIVPDRVRIQAKLLEEEKSRLGVASAPDRR